MKDGFYSEIKVGLENCPDAKLIRQDVFMSEQGFVNEFDDEDSTAAHLVIRSENGVPAATGRLFFKFGEAHIGRIAVSKCCRKHGLGSLAVNLLEEYAASKGAGVCVLLAQTRVKAFYESLGYSAEGEERLDEFCPHILMKKALLNTIEILNGEYSVCKVKSLPPVQNLGEFVFTAKTDSELSIVCQTKYAPRGSVAQANGRRLMRVKGCLDFSLVGVLSGILMPLSENGISVFTLSTYDTDYIMIESKDLERAVSALRKEGYTVI